MSLLFWLHYQVNTSGDVVTVGALQVNCFGCSTITILVVALSRSPQCVYIVVVAVPY